MLADQLDYVVGVDPHRDSHALAVVDVRSGAVVFEATVAASSDGYRQALVLGDQHAPGRRVFAVEGTGSFGAGLTRFLSGRGERVLEVGRLRRERRTGGKTDALDAVRAARSVLADKRAATPRAGAERQALQALVAAREGAVNAKRAGLCQLRDLLITTPEPLRAELRPLTRARLLQRLAATRPDGRRDPELRGSLLALRSIARRILHLTAEEREPARAIETLTRKLAPQLLNEPGVGPHAAAQLVQRSPTSNADAQKARPNAKQPAASSATSPATSTDSSNTGRPWSLDKHRSITSAHDSPRSGLFLIEPVARLAEGVPVSGCSRPRRRRPFGSRRGRR
jgi:hypothetical protein